MARIKEPIKWILAGLLVGFVIFSVLGAQTMAKAAPPPQSPLEQMGLYQIQMSSSHFKLDWSVLGSGGEDISSAHFKVSSTIGQPTVGEKSSSHFNSCTGFWCWVDLIKEIFLPLIIKQ